MHGASITLAEIFMKNNKSYDLIIASDFLNLPLFKSLCHEKLGEIKIVIYFHENQITYPWSPNDKDLELNRDKHYSFINYTSALSSNHIFLLLYTFEENLQSIFQCCSFFRSRLYW